MKLQMAESVAPAVAAEATPVVVTDNVAPVAAAVVVAPVAAAAPESKPKHAIAPEEKKRTREDKDRRRSRSRSRDKKKERSSRREEVAPHRAGPPIKSASGWAVMVGGLEGGETETSLRDRFSVHGMVGRIFVNRSLRTGLAVSALLEFEVATEAEAAIAACKGRAGFAVLDEA